MSPHAHKQPPPHHVAFLRLKTHIYAIFFSLIVLYLSISFFFSLLLSHFQSQSVSNFNSDSISFSLRLPSLSLSHLSLALRQTKSHSSVQTAHMSHQTKLPVRFMSNLPNSFSCLPVLLPRASPPSPAAMTQSYTAFALSLHNRSDSACLRRSPNPIDCDRRHRSQCRLHIALRTSVFSLHHQYISN